MKRVAPRSLILLLLVAASCSETGEGAKLFKVEKRLVEIETTLSSVEARVSETVRVACAGNYDDGTTEPFAISDVTVRLTPSEGATLVGDALTFTRSGTFEVECTKDSLTTKPAELTVKPGIAVRVVATLDRNQVAAGSTVRVTCTVQDQFGNAISAGTPQVRSQPSRGTSISGNVLTGEFSGDYSVYCLLDRLERVSADLEVVAGTPARVATTLDRYTVRASERAEVTCLVVDTYSNTVEIDTEFSVTPQPDLQDASGLAAYTADDYFVTCEVPTVALSSDPVLLKVNPGLPAELNIVEVQPDKPVYSRSEVVEPIVVIKDAYQNIVRAADLELTGIPAGSVLDVGFDQALLIGNGTVSLVVSVSSQTHNNQPVQDSVELLVDGTPPEIEITFPTRAQIVVRNPASTLTIRGRVTDSTTSVTALSVNGNMVNIDSNGDFTTTMRPSWGINLIEASAWDEAGNERDLTQSFEIATRYRRARNTRITSGRIDDGIIAHLGRAVLDDNNSDVDDLATIAKLAIQNTDINALIPNPVTTFNSDCSIPFVTIRGALRLHVDRVAYGTPVIDITPINGGIRLRVEVPNVLVNLRTSGDVCEIGVGIRGSATASRIVVQGDLLISHSGSGVRVTMPNRTVSISGLRIDLDLPAIIDWAVDGIINLFRGAISNQLESAFSNVIRDQIPPVVEGFLESIELGTGFNLPAPVSLRLNVNTVLGSSRFNTQGGDLGMDTTIFTTGAITPEPVGGIMQESVSTPTFSSTRPLGVGLAYDLVNQALYSLWYGGGLDIDIGEEFLPEQISNGGSMLTIDAHATALLPPVIKPTGSSTWPVQLQIGDLKLDLTIENVPQIGTINATVYAAAFVDANIVMNNRNELELTLKPNPRIAFDFMTPLDGILDLTAFIDQLEATVGLLLPQLVGQVLQGIPIPNFDLSNLSGGFLPPGIVLGLGNAQTRFHPNYVLLEGNIVDLP